MRHHVDIISTLPDELLCCILSLLPTKDAIRTCILSSRWINIMAFVPVVDFECHLPTFDFINTLDKLLLGTCSSTNLQKLRLHIGDCHGNIVPFRVNDWVHSAINRNVVDLDVRLPDFDFDGHSSDNHEVLALRITACNSLQILNISGGLGLHMPSTTGCFKNLKTFKAKLNDPSKEMLENLFCSLPQLEELLLEGNFSNLTKVDKNICINITVPALKWLSLCINQEEHQDVDFKVLIDAPILEYIFLEDDYLAAYSVRSSPSVVKATLNVGRKYYCSDFIDEDDCWLRAIELIGGLSCAKSLSVIDGASVALDCIAEELPILHGLTYLELDDLCFSGLSLIPLFLEIAPNLKVFITILPDVYDIEGWLWISPEPVPTCLSHLEVFEVKGAEIIKDKPSYNEMVEYISTNAKVLRKFVI